MPQLDRGRFDAALISQPPYLEHHLDFRAFAREQMIVLAPLDWPTVDPYEIIRTYPFIRFTRTLWAGQWIDQWLHQEKIIVNELMEIDNL